MATPGRFKPPKFTSRKRRSSYQRFSSNDSSDRSMRKKSHHRPDPISSWTTKTLDEYGISYNNDPISIEEFTSIINSRHHQVCKKKLPDFLSTLKMLCNNGLVFSLDVPEKETEKTLENFSDKTQSVRAILTEFDTFVNDILKKEDEYFEKEWRKKALFFAWSHNVRSFLNYYKKFLEIMNSSVTERWLGKPVREAHLKELFMMFTKIFFLEPELGDKEIKRLIIGTEVLSCTPDIRFTCSNPLQRSVLLTLTVVKKAELSYEKKTFKKRKTLLSSGSSFESNKAFEKVRTRHSSGSSSESDQSCGNFIHRIVDINALGRHGGELLSELRSSAFAPTVVLGCICMGTEIIFTYLEMSGTHLHKIVYDGKCDSESSIIRYTKPLNYFVEEDRNKCLDLLLLLGFIQTSGYEDLYPDFE